MDWDDLYGILFQTTLCFRKNDEIIERHSIRIAEVALMPHIDELGPDLEQVDVEFFIVAVNTEIAATLRDDLIAVLRQYSPPAVASLSYITVGAEIGGEGAALQVFALGKVLGLWELLVPSGTDAREQAANGFVTITGFQSVWSS